MSLSEESSRPYGTGAFDVEGGLVSVRRAKPDDLGELVRLHRQASEFLGRWDPRLALSSGTLERFKKRVRLMLGSASYPVFVAQRRDDEALLGCVIGKVVDNKPFAVPGFGYIGCLYVDDGWRGQEVGCRLLGEAQDWFKSQGLDVSQSDVASRSPIARRFWERMGFSRFLDHLYYSDDHAVAKVGDRGVVIRAATIGDAAAVLSLWMEMMDYHARLDSRLRVSPDGSRHVAKAIEHWLLDDTAQLLVAQARDDVVGFTLGGIVDVGLGLKPAKYGHIAHMCVTSEWRRRGVGRQLFTALRRWLQGEGLGSVHIYVSHFNPASQRFWRSLGFQDYVDRLWCDLR